MENNTQQDNNTISLGEMTLNKIRETHANNRKTIEKLSEQIASLQDTNHNLEMSVFEVFPELHHRQPNPGFDSRPSDFQGFGFQNPSPFPNAGFGLGQPAFGQRSPSQFHALFHNFGQTPTQFGSGFGQVPGSCGHNHNSQGLSEDQKTGRKLEYAFLAKRALQDQAALLADIWLALEPIQGEIHDDIREKLSNRMSQLNAFNSRWTDI